MHRWHVKTNDHLFAEGPGGSISKKNRYQSDSDRLWLVIINGSVLCNSSHLTRRPGRPRVSVRRYVTSSWHAHSGHAPSRSRGGHVKGTSAWTPQLDAYVLWELIVSNNSLRQKKSFLSSMLATVVQVEKGCCLPLFVVFPIFMSSQLCAIVETSFQRSERTTGWCGSIEHFLLHSNLNFTPNITTNDVGLLYIKTDNYTASNDELLSVYLTDDAVFTSTKQVMYELRSRGELLIDWGTTWKVFRATRETATSSGRQKIPIFLTLSLSLLFQSLFMILFFLLFAI